MQRLSSLLLMIAATGVAGYLYLPPSNDAAEDLADVIRISVAPDRDGGSAGRFAPTNQAFLDRTSPRNDRLAEPLAASPGAATPPAEAKPSGGWTTVVMSGESGSTAFKTSTPDDPETRYMLTRDLQRELKRVGCYGGEITGAWSPSTRRAMAAFINRANATLPTDEPDLVLLALVQSHSDMVCGAQCPDGEMLSKAGRCVPHAVVAQSERKARRMEERQLAQKQRLLAEQEQQRPTRAAPPAEKLAAATPNELPWLNRPTAPTNPNVAEAAPARPVAPLAGRMAIGGPRNDMARPDTTVPDTTAISPDRGPAPAWNEEMPNAGSAVAEREVERKKRRPRPAADEPKAKPRKSYYASNTGKTRRGQPRPGTMQYNVMQTLGGIY